MQKLKWERLYDMISEKYHIERETKKEIPLEKGGIKELQRVIIFSTPKGKMKLEILIKPRVEDTKYFYHRRTDRGARQTTTYSPTEKTEIIKLFLFNQNSEEWEEIDVGKL